MKPICRLHIFEGVSSVLLADTVPLLFFVVFFASVEGCCLIVGCLPFQGEGPSRKKKNFSNKVQSTSTFQWPQSPKIAFVISVVQGNSERVVRVDVFSVFDSYGRLDLSTHSSWSVLCRLNFFRSCCPSLRPLFRMLYETHLKFICFLTP